MSRRAIVQVYSMSLLKNLGFHPTGSNAPMCRVVLLAQHGLHQHVASKTTIISIRPSISSRNETRSHVTNTQQDLLLTSRETAQPTIYIYIAIKTFPSYMNVNTSSQHFVPATHTLFSHFTSNNMQSIVKSDVQRHTSPVKKNY